MAWISTSFRNVRGRDELETPKYYVVRRGDSKIVYVLRRFTRYEYASAWACRYSVERVLYIIWINAEVWSGVTVMRG